jgi:hypothetical protein
VGKAGSKKHDRGTDEEIAWKGKSNLGGPQLRRDGNAPLLGGNVELEALRARMPFW